MIWNF